MSQNYVMIWYIVFIFEIVSCDALGMGLSWDSCSEPLDCHKYPNFTLDSRKMGGEGELPSQQKQLVEGFDSHGAVLVHSFNCNTGFVFLNLSAGSGSIVLSSAMSFTDT